MKAIIAANPSIIKTNLKSLTLATHSSNQHMPLHSLHKPFSKSVLVNVSSINNTEQLRNKLKEFNQVAVIKIENEDYNQALVYLEEAEKILEAAVSRGNKKIDRTFIICTLQNEACAYQRLWELEKSAEYMEAIIHNMQSEVQISTSIELQEIYFSSDAMDDKQSIKISISKLTLMGLYYLQYLAVTSQIKDHEKAYQAGLNALKTFKLLCQKCSKLQTLEADTHTDSAIANPNMMSELGSINLELDTDRIPQQIKQTKKMLSQLKKTISRKKSITDKAVICFKDFAIGQVMQISPITLTQLVQKINSKEEVTYISKFYKALYISICFFSMATEKRLMCTEVSKKHKRQINSYLQSDNIKISQSYHLKAIQIACKYIPCQNKYLQHIIRSLKNHYQIDLLEGSASELIDQVSSIDLQSQNLMASYERAETHHHGGINTYSNTTKLKNDRKINSIKEQKSGKKNESNKSSAKKDNERANYTPFGNTIIKKQFEFHYKKKIIKSEKHINAIFSENHYPKNSKNEFKQKTKSAKKTDRHSKNSKVSKKQSITVFADKKSHPSSTKSIEANNRFNSHHKKQKNPHIQTQNALKTYQNRNHETYENEQHGFPKKSEIKPDKSKLKKKKKLTSMSKDKQKSSKSKSRNKSNKKLSNASKEDKISRNNQKAKRKTNRLQQQYFVKVDNKRKHKSKNGYKSALKKNSFKGEEGSPCRNTPPFMISSAKNPNFKNSMKYY